MQQRTAVTSTGQMSCASAELLFSRGASRQGAPGPCLVTGTDLSSSGALLPWGVISM